MIGVVSSFTQGSARLAVVAAIAAASGWTLLAGFRAVRGTTLRAPMGWGLLSVLWLSAVEAAASTMDLGRWEVPLRFSAAVSTFGPIMAILGAKRPQDRGWQIIVFSLWILLQIPCAQWLLFRTGPALQLFPAWIWFLAVLIAISSLNYLPTRYGWASVLFTVGQLVLLSDHLPISATWFARSPLVGMACITLSALVVLVQSKLRRGKRLTSADRVWLDFRDSYGLLWAVRLAARVNAAADMLGWDMRLRWRGLAARQGGEIMDDETAVAVHKNMRTLLRRFVSNEWIEKRKRGDVDFDQHAREIL